jgi:hypothetical protein
LCLRTADFGIALPAYQVMRHVAVRAVGLGSRLSVDALSAQAAVRRYTKWCQDPAVLLAARVELGELVERVTRATRS